MIFSKASSHVKKINFVFLCHVRHPCLSEARYVTWASIFLLQELSQEKQRTLELLGVKEEKQVTEMTEEHSACRTSEDGEDLGDMDLLQDLKHIEEQMKLLLTEKEEAEDKWVRSTVRIKNRFPQYFYS